MKDSLHWKGGAENVITKKQRDVQRSRHRKVPSRCGNSEKKKREGRIRNNRMHKIGSEGSLLGTIQGLGELYSKRRRGNLQNIIEEDKTKSGKKEEEKNKSGTSL